MDWPQERQLHGHMHTIYFHRNTENKILDGGDARDIVRSKERKGKFKKVLQEHVDNGAARSLRQHVPRTTAITSDGMPNQNNTITFDGKPCNLVFGSGNDKVQNTNGDIMRQIPLPQTDYASKPLF